MRKLVLAGLAALAGLGAVVATPQVADAQVYFSVGQRWGHRPYYRPHYYGPGYYAPRYYAPAPVYVDPVYAAPRRCYIVRRYVETGWGVHPRNVRVCH